ncbi:MAG: hypothetical protein Q8O55_09090 [Dehalococcoidales bacterium]|nr:hypothetical protein [Dehalococcoidales bacterium]
MSEEFYGARIYRVDQNVILVKQTIKKPIRNTKSARYMVDVAPDGTHKERHVDIADEKSIAAAVREALEGKL